MSGIHDRMPAILDDSAVGFWLNPDCSDQTKLKRLLCPYKGDPKDEGEIDPEDDSQPSRSLRVLRVVDGDTILVIEDGKETKVRLIGIDTPELTTDECLATGAKAYLEELVENHTIVPIADDSQGDLDKYARKLGYIKRNDGLFINMELIIHGFAKEYTYRTPYFYQHAFRLAQAYASNNNLGIWDRSVCNR